MTRRAYLEKARRFIPSAFLTPIIYGVFDLMTELYSLFGFFSTKFENICCIKICMGWLREEGGEVFSRIS
jgi:hypothetical protein